MNRLRLTHAFVLMLLAVLGTACSQDERDLPQPGQPIREPLQISIASPRMNVTRSTSDGDGNTWAGGEHITLVVGNNIVAGTPTTITDHVYTVNGSGTSQSLTALNLTNTNFWTSTSETKKIIGAWSYGTTTAPVLTSHTLTAYTLANPQTNTTGELLYAPATSQTAYTAVPNSFALTFYHQLAKVVFLVKSDATATVSTPVMTIPGSGTLTSPDDDGSYDAAWTPASTDASITPHTESPTTTETADGVIAKYSAVIIPGDYDGKTLLSLNVGSTTYNYTGGTEVNNLKSGKRYTITVTVRNKLVVNAITVNAWTTGSNIPMAL